MKYMNIKCVNLYGTTPNSETTKNKTKKTPIFSIYNHKFVEGEYWQSF